jgi:hypothetical protein
MRALGKQRVRSLARGFRSAKDALETFIADAKDKQPYEGIVWEAAGWDVMAANRERAHIGPKTREMLWFTLRAPLLRTGEDRIAFLGGFADLVKAAIVVRRVTRGALNGSQRTFVVAARALYDVLPLKVRKDVTLLTRENFVRAEASLQGSNGTKYNRALNLEELSGLVDRYNLARARIDYRSSIPRPDDVNDRTSTTFDERVAGLPSAEVLYALADIANTPKLREQLFDLLRMHIVSLLLVCGFRVGEVLTLPANALVREFVLDEAHALRRDPITGKPVERIGIRYWPEKGGPPVVKWVPTVANDLVVRAIESIKQICSPARANAVWLERHPGKVNVRLNPRQYYTMRQAAAIMPYQYEHVRRRLSEDRCGGKKNITLRKGRPYITGAALMRALASERNDRPMLTRDDGWNQLLGSSLIVIFRYQGHGSYGTNWRISVPVTSQQLGGFLCGLGRFRSVFERYGYRDADGKPMRIRTHDFRRIVDTMAERGGLSEAEIALWLGRRTTRDNRAYDYRSAGEMAEVVHEAISRDEVYGTIADQWNATPANERASFLKDSLTQTHTTPNGECGSNLAETPCEVALSCLSGCVYYYRNKNDQKSRKALLRIKERTIEALQHARHGLVGQTLHTMKQAAASWVASQETILRNLERALAIDDDDAIPNGQLMQIFLDGKIVGRPLGKTS